MSEPKSTRTAYDGKQVEVVLEQWEDGEREVVRHPGAAAIVAVHDGAVVLVRLTREAARKKLLETPAGKIDEGEAPLDAAKRELEEEVGLKGGRWRELGTYFSSPGFTDERMHLFVAEDLEHGEQDLDAGEDIEIVRWPVEEIEQRLAEVEDLKTLAGLLLFLRER